MMAEHAMVELGGIEPPSAEVIPTALRPFPRFRLTEAGLPGQLGVATPPPGLCQVSVVFPTVSGLSLRSPTLLLPGCAGQAPCAITGHDDSLLPDGSGSESELAVGGSFFVPV